MSTTLRTSSDDVVEVIFEAILKNRLNPGVKLSEISLQEEFGYSRSVIRQGFDRLVDSGVLIHKKIKAFVWLVQRNKKLNKSLRQGKP